MSNGSINVYQDFIKQRYNKSNSPNLHEQSITKDGTESAVNRMSTIQFEDQGNEFISMAELGKSSTL